MSKVVARSPLVVVGTSARGVEALAELLCTLPASFPAPIVVAQPFDPTRPSHLSETLARRSPLPVVTVTVSEHAPLQSGTVYIVPANHHAQITDHELIVLPDGAWQPQPALDMPLTSAPAANGEQLTTVIWTGTGFHDAGSGRAVHEAGGTFVIQNPVIAAYPGMSTSESLAPQGYTSHPDLAEHADDLQPLTLAQDALQRRLLQGVIQAQENERRRVARELHDDIGQALTALVLVLGVIQDALPAQAERERLILEDATGLAENVMSGLRRVITDLRPPVLDDLGLVPALRRLGRDLHERAGVTVVTETDETNGRLPPEVEITLFRVAQEALANIGKHAQARQARIILRLDPKQVTLQITDDGRGLPPAISPDREAAHRDQGHFGLLGMQERVALLNGVLRVESAPRQGTTVWVELPLGAA
ncbi:MAG TPA: chemotaxis protein CheB [Chloroflexia bacterium]|jgi:signal transduction histidine kinase